MTSFIKKSLPTLLFTLFVILLTLYILLDAFFIERPISEAPMTRDPSLTLPPVTTTSAESTTQGGNTNTPESSTTAQGSSSPDTSDETPDVQYPIIGDLYYKDENIEISIEETYFTNKNGIDNKMFVVDLKLSDIEYLRTALAKEQYGYKIRETTTEMAERYDAIFAINGDYYGYRKDGFVLRNYKLFRYTPRDRNSDDALGILRDGSLFMFDENNMNPQNLLEAYVYQCFSFGPRLVENGSIMVDEDSEVDQSAPSNPRTAIGMIEPLHYKIVVAEGRLPRYHDKDGLTLLELASVMKSLGCDTAYNLDGGSSTTLYFNGRVLNELPGAEREISDIIFINGKTYSEDPNRP